MTKHVPEDSVLPREEQLEQLRRKLLGNSVFGRCRGTLGNSVVGVVSDLIKKSGSPTKFCSSWDALAADVRVMGNLIAQYNRDGWADAARTLHQALCNRNFVIPGEIIPIEETIPVTILMLDPERTFLMLNWLLREHWMDLNCWLDNKDGRSKVSPKTRTNLLFTMFPTLEARSRNRRRHRMYEGYDLIGAYHDSVTNIFSNISEIKMEAFELTFGQWNDHIELDGQKFLYLFQGEQDELLRHFTRDEQKRISTWQARVPKAMRHFLIGIHAEKEHGRWTKEFPSLVSKGLSHSHGAVILTSNPIDRGEEVSKLYRTEHQGSQDSGADCERMVFDNH